MVSISDETPEQTRVRLRSVISRARMQILDGTWSFLESPIDQPPGLADDVLAVVRDEGSWSALRRNDSSGQDSREHFGLMSFHFPVGEDNSGFVGWLANELKHRLGTGVFVICGSNSADGGIYDYWGCPVELLDEVVAVVRELGAAQKGVDQ